MSLPAEVFPEIDDLRKGFSEIPSRPEAVRLVVAFAKSKEKEFHRFAERRQAEG